MADREAAPAQPRTATVHTVWAGEHRFDTARPGGPAVRFDGAAATGPSPMDALLGSLAACSGIDVVDILAKRRTPVARLEIRVTGTRREELPRRFTRIALEYHVDGEGIGAEHAERAVALAFEKYCSAAASLAPDIEAETTLVLNGRRHAPVRQPLGG